MAFFMTYEKSPKPVFGDLFVIIHKPHDPIQRKNRKREIRVWINVSRAVLVMRGLYQPIATLVPINMPVGVSQTFGIAIPLFPFVLCAL